MPTTAVAGEPEALDAPPAVVPGGVSALAYVGLSCMSGCWAAGFVIGKLVLADFTPLAAAALRYAFAIAVLLPFAVRARPRHGLGRAAGPLAFMIVAGGVVYPWLFLLALSRT